MKSKIALILILSLFLGSCVTQRKCALKFPVNASKDSIYIETITEKPVYIPGDSILVEVPVIDCPDQDLVEIETGKLKQLIKILNGKLIASTLIKPDTIFVPVVETVTIVKEVKVPEPIKVIPEIYKNAMRICIFIFAGFFIFVGWKIYRIFKR